MRILITGGMGYLGRFVAHFLREKPSAFLLVDNLSRCPPLSEKVPELVQLDVGNVEGMKRILSDFQPEVVLHFGGWIIAGESWEQPAQYWEKNVVNTFRLLQAMKSAGISKIIYPSSAAIFSGGDRIAEAHTPAPLTPYAKTKLSVEKILEQASREWQLGGFILRIFNLAGALPEAHLGEEHQPETHLIPLAVRAVLGKHPALQLKTGFSTPDGTSIRDYISVEEVAQLILSLLPLCPENALEIFHIGSGTGYSALQVVRRLELLTGKNVPVDFESHQRPEPAHLVANIQKIHRYIGWQPKHSLDHLLLATLKYEQQK